MTAASFDATSAIGGAAPARARSAAPARPGTSPESSTSCGAALRACAHAALAVSRYFGVVNSTRAPLLPRIVHTCAGLYAVSSGTATAPSHNTPRYDEIQRASLSARIATR